MAMSKTKRRPRPGAAEATRSTAQLFRDFLEKRLAESAIAWAERMPTYRPSASVQPAEEQPQELPEPSTYTWTKEDEEERTAHRIALATRPFNFGMSDAVHRRTK